MDESNWLSEEDALKEVGNRLMQGWTMLQDTCPLSNFPLISKDGVVFSVRCNMEVRTEGAAQFANAPEPAASRPATRSAADDYSQRMSEKLLLGWQMLEEQCPVTGAVPLMRSPDGRLWSAATDAFLDGAADGTAPAAASPRVAPPPAGAHSQWREPAESPSASDRRARTDLYSSRMGEKLLQGWRMLDRNCPATGAVPLMQSPDGRLWSAATDEFLSESPRADADAGAGAAEKRSESELEMASFAAAAFADAPSSSPSAASAFERSLPASFAPASSAAARRSPSSRAPLGVRPEYERSLPDSFAGECSFVYRYISRESCSQFDSLPLTSLTIACQIPSLRGRPSPLPLDARARARSRARPRPPRRRPT